MDQIDQVDFLNFGPKQIRHQIREILISYSHAWDILAEAVQNSVDAIKKRGPVKGHIKITIDRAASQISIEDNGTGIAAIDLPGLMSPFSSTKANEPQSVGEKGVGITFVLFSSSYFEIQTRTDSESVGFRMDGAEGWLSSSNEVLPRLTKIPETRHDVGTTVLIRLSSGHPIFTLTFEEIEFILRTKTAVGDTAHVFNLPLFNCDYVLTVISQDGSEKQSEGECKYLLPTEYLLPSNVADVDEFEKWRVEADRSDAQKRNYWRDKAAIASGSKVRDGRQIRFWFFYVPRRSWWEEINKSAGLPQIDQDDIDAALSIIGFSGGMEISTKFTPSGISEELKPRGSAGYIPNFFFLVDDPGVKLDIGRKSVASPPLTQLAAIGYEAFRRIINDVQKYTSGAPDLQSDFDRDEAFHEIDGYPDLDSKNSSFRKRPNGQEAVVSAMFFELIGNGTFKDYKLLSSGYKGKYDLFAQKGPSKVVVEFKYNLSGLLKDFREEAKLFAEVDVVVLWEITEADRKEVKRRGLDILTNSPPPGKVNRFPEAQSKLSFSVGIVRDIWIIELSKLI